MDIDFIDQGATTLQSNALGLQALATGGQPPGSRPCWSLKADYLLIYGLNLPFSEQFWGKTRLKEADRTELWALAWQFGPGES